MLAAMLREQGDKISGSERGDVENAVADAGAPPEFGDVTTPANVGQDPLQIARHVRTLETIAELPWNSRGKDHLDVKEASRILDEDHYALNDVKDRILEFLAVRQLWQSRAKSESEAKTVPVCGRSRPSERRIGRLSQGSLRGSGGHTPSTMPLSNRALARGDASALAASAKSRVPASITALAFRPSGVPAATAPRSRSPPPPPRAHTS